MSIAACPLGNVLTDVDPDENDRVYQTCQCVARGDSAILNCDLDGKSLVLKVGWDGAGQGRVGRAGRAGRGKLGVILGW